MGALAAGVLLVSGDWARVGGGNLLVFAPYLFSMGALSVGVVLFGRVANRWPRDVLALSGCLWCAAGAFLYLSLLSEAPSSVLLDWLLLTTLLAYWAVEGSIALGTARNRTERGGARIYAGACGLAILLSTLYVAGALTFLRVDEIRFWEIVGALLLLLGAVQVARGYITGRSPAR